MLNSMATPLALDPDAFFEEFFPRVFQFVASMSGASGSDVDDLVQETLLYAWKNRLQFRQESAPLTWVLSIARNRIRMRRRSLARTATLERALRELDRQEISRDLVRSEEACGALRRALGTLDPDLQELLVRRYLEGRSVREIADGSGHSEKAIESKLH